ncbi:adenylate kinase [Candidatus Dojkabacteria bacterium]|nr:adenylate kinase [Candidatus Dojkabacteria bacterium]
MKYVIFGVPGVGKTAVIEKVIASTGIIRINWGDLTEEIMREQGLIKNRDEMRKLNLRSQRPVQEQVVKKILDIGKESGDLLIETHAAMKTPQGYWPGLNFDSLRQLDPDTFVAIETSAENIFSRREKDTTRDRKDDLSIEDLEEHIRVTRILASTFAVLTGGTAYFVENKEGDIDYAAGRIIELIERGRA